MRYEEVETVLPKTFVPKPDPVAPISTETSITTSNENCKSHSPTSSSVVSSAVDSSAYGSESESTASNGKKKKKPLRSLMSRIRGTWRSKRRKSRRKAKKTSNSSEASSLAIRKVDSNATEVRSNTTKALMRKMADEAKMEEDSREQDQEGTRPLQSIREEATSSPLMNPVLNTEHGLTGESSNAISEGVDLPPALAKDFSIEVGDEDDHIVLGMIPTVHPSSTNDGSTALINRNTDNSRSLVLAGSNANDSVVQTSSAPSNAHNQLALQDTTQNKKWVKKVSLSIGGYKTSFQFSDPLVNLAETVNEALDVMSDAALVEEAKARYEVPEEDKEERDYDENPTKLFMYLQQRAWGLAVNQLKKAPGEAKIWVYRKQRPKPAPNVNDGYQSQSLVLQSQALVVFNGDDAVKLRWKLLPLHASIVLGAPPEIIMDIIRAYPDAAQKPDERGSLPVHLAASRLDVDPEGEKVVLQLFGAYPDSIQMQDRKGRTPPELAKLARIRKEVEEQRRHNAYQEVPGIEKTASNFKREVEEEENANSEDDDCSVKTSMSARFKMLLKKSHSVDTVDRRKKKKKKESSRSSSLSLLSKAKSVDVSEQADEMGPGFAILKPTKEYEARVQLEKMLSSDLDEGKQTCPQDRITKNYVTPEHAPPPTEVARLIPLPKSFCEDEASVKSRSKTPPLDNIDENIEVNESSKPEFIDLGVHAELNQPNEALRVLLEKAAENAGRGGEDVSEYLRDLEDEWVTDVEALRRIDGETLDIILPIILSREVQRLVNCADSIDNKFLTEDIESNNGSSNSIGNNRGRSMRKGKKKKRSSSRKLKRLSERRSRSVSEGSFNEASEDPSDDDLSIVTEAHSVYSRANGTVRINETPTQMKLKDEEGQNEDSSKVEGELEIRKLHANLILDARKKFPTRESLEEAIRGRQQEVEAAVKAGFDVDKQTLSRAALADDEIRKLLPLRLILPSLDDLTEMINVLQVHKENALRNTEIKKALEIQTEIDELQSQIDLEKNYILQKKIQMSVAKCVTCGEEFVPEKKLVGILKTKEPNCPKCCAPQMLPKVRSVENGGGAFGTIVEGKKSILMSVGSMDGSVNSTGSKKPMVRSVGSTDGSVTSTGSKKLIEKTVGSTDGSVTSTGSKKPMIRTVGSTDGSVASASKKTLTLKSIGSTDGSITSTGSKKMKIKSVKSANPDLTGTQNDPPLDLSIKDSDKENALEVQENK